MTRLLFLLTLLMLTPGLALAGAQTAGYEVETAVYKDLGRRLTIDTAADAHFVPTSATMGLGFDAPLTWLRLTLRKRASGVNEPAAGQPLATGSPETQSCARATSIASRSIRVAAIRPRSTSRSRPLGFRS